MSEATAPYTLYAMDLSYFSGKLEAYLRYKGIPHDRVTATARVLDDLYRWTGVKKVPALRGQDGQWLFDTTPTIALLEERHPERSITPPDPVQAFLAALLEDYADEWLWRPAMWWRWEPLPSRKALGWRVALEVDPPGLPHAVIAWFFAHRQRWTWLWGDGMNRQNSAAVRDLYLEELDVLQGVLSQQPYLLGDQPSAADFGYFGPMFRHFGNDPDPAEIMRRRAPAVYEWLARLWNAGAQPSPSPRWLAPQGPLWAPLWQRVCGDYLPYLQANAQAWQAGRKRFDFAGQSQHFKGTVTHHYRVWCLQQLQRKYRALSPAQQQELGAEFAAYGGLAPLQGDGEIDAGLDALYQLPRAQGQYRPGWRIALLGQPRN